MARPALPTHPDLPDNRTPERLREPTTAGASAVKVLVTASAETMTAAAEALPSDVMVRELRRRGYYVQWAERGAECDCAGECSGQDEDVELIAREAVEDD